MRLRSSGRSCFAQDLSLARPSREDEEYLPSAAAGGRTGETFAAVRRDESTKAAAEAVVDAHRAAARPASSGAIPSADL